MTTEKKLSEFLAEWSNSEFEDSLAADARALEERVAELEDWKTQMSLTHLEAMRHWKHQMTAADARAETAEATAVRLKEENNRYDEESYLMAERLHAAEAELAWQVAAVRARLGSGKGFSAGAAALRDSLLAILDKGGSE